MAWGSRRARDRKLAASGEQAEGGVAHGVAASDARDGGGAGGNGGERAAAEPQGCDAAAQGGRRALDALGRQGQLGAAPGAQRSPVNAARWRAAPRLRRRASPTHHFGASCCVDDVCTAARIGVCNDEPRPWVLHDDAARRPGHGWLPPTGDDGRTNDLSPVDKQPELPRRSPHRSLRSIRQLLRHSVGRRLDATAALRLLCACRRGAVVYA
mmetsp:Transcript_13193/g.34577  ORF Transcript_13193/g.34577 Transcript_13193/m.34577 type:complete len:212 (-) Transcript_13193:546-1181(-)